MPNFTTRTVAHAASTFVIFVLCVVLIGWIFDIALFKSVMPGFVTMKVNTAIALLLSGVSLWLLSRQTSSSLLLIAQVTAIAVTFCGLLTLCQYLFRWNLGVDQFLFRDLLKAVKISHLGRMEANTGVNFLLSGVLAIRAEKSPQLLAGSGFELDCCFELFASLRWVCLRGEKFLPVRRLYYLNGVTHSTSV